MSQTSPPSAGGPAPIAGDTPVARRKEQRAWYFYDWANSAYVTTVTTVMFGPYLIGVAKEAAVDNRVQFLGFLSLAPGALPGFIIAFATILSALVLPPLGALMDRTKHKKQFLAGFAWTGAASAALIWFATGDNWQIAAFAVVVANLCLGASTVVNDSILCLISSEEERDRVSSRGWAFGYLGGGILLVVNLGTVMFYEPLGIPDEGTAARISMLSAAIWWAGFTFIPFLRLRNYEPTAVVPESGSILRQSFGQLWETLKELRNYPMALTFLLAYLFFNDGIQTVIGSSAVYGAEELHFDQDVLIATILLVQFVGIAGALLFGKAAERYGAKRVILVGIAIWMAIVTVALFLPERRVLPFLVLAVAIGLVLGGTQALARSFFSLLIPKGKEAEYFSFYHAMERGTSWFGALTFAMVFQLTDSYRPAIFALIAFFVLGGALLMRVDTERGIREAGNVPPSVV
ncbi:MAG TPA: MFS transporter [Nocardioidaceae bacterium]|nr:MFS transporter [Nocardioidaceae bacterium]